ncbi:MAG: hypothetical protein EOM21_18750 [Gammaproteobacteria bacterium]|nr:hypothetical protein [Gammaproteobacteria bacterium]
MQWFRFYTEFATDPKVQTLTEAMQRRLVMLFCLQGSGDYEHLDQDEVAFALRIDIETLHETFHLFQKKGFLDENCLIKNWDKRQYKSDKSTERVKKHRDKSKGKQDETPMKRFSNGDVTPPDTDTDTDIDRDKSLSPSKNEIQSDFENEFWPDASRKVGKDAARKAYVKARGRAAKHDIHAAWRAMNTRWLAKKGTDDWRFVPHPSTWLNEGRWQDEEEPEREKVFSGMFG